MVNFSPSSLFILWYFFCEIAFAARGTSLSLPIERDVASPASLHTLSQLRRRQTGTITTDRDRSLYWFGNFSVGDSPSRRLLIDTGSTDLILNKGLYNPSKHSKRYGTGKFTETYEGVARSGFGYETIKGTVASDVVSAGGLSVPDQAVGVRTSTTYHDKRSSNNTQPDQGIIGFVLRSLSKFNPPAPSWFQHLCINKAITQCKLGLAFGTNGKGNIIIGEVGENLIAGELVVIPSMDPEGSLDGAYTVKGDVTVGNKIVVKNQTITLDDGTSNIQGPIEATQEIYKILGYKGHIQGSGRSKTLTASFPCNKPPVLGFSFPAEAYLKPGQKATIFNVSPAVWDVYNHGNNSCASILGGTTAEDGPGAETDWLLGQPFYEGHYVEFDIADMTLGFGNLKDPSGAGSA